MTKHGNYGIGGEKVGIFPLTFCTTTHYTIHLPQICSSPSKNPAPISSRENLSTTKTPISVFHKTGFARIGHTSQSLIIRNPKALFEGKSLRVISNCGEGKVLPHYMQNRFEGYKGSLHQYSNKGVKSQTS